MQGAHTLPIFRNRPTRSVPGWGSERSERQNKAENRQGVERSESPPKASQEQAAYARADSILTAYALANQLVSSVAERVRSPIPIRSRLAIRAWASRPCCHCAHVCPVASIRRPVGMEATVGHAARSTQCRLGWSPAATLGLSPRALILALGDSPARRDQAVQIGKQFFETVERGIYIGQVFEQCRPVLE